MRKGVGWMPYIEVQPSSELSRFNLRGLTPEMFCVNISDMVNVRGLSSGVVENELQLPVAHWEINQDDYRRAINIRLTHAQVLDLLIALPGYVEEVDDEFIEFEERVIQNTLTDEHAAYGYRLTIATTDIGNKTAPFAYYHLDTNTEDNWQGYPPPVNQHETIRNALARQLQAISDAGVQLNQVFDATDYAISGQ